MQSEVDVPGGIYLCQVDEHISCGACCGLYNVDDASRTGLQRLLAIRTAAFQNVVRSAEALTAFARNQLQQLGRAPFPDFHHCPFVGLIGPQQTRIGCLLHPLAIGNNGIDFRGLSYYGGMACRIYFCPSCHQLTADEKIIVRDAVADWYAYGLIVTETQLLKAFFKEIEDRGMQSIEAERIVASQRCLQLVTEFLLLKLQWPFRRHARHHPCNYFFEDRRYRRSSIDYTNLGVAGSRFDELFRSLNSHFRNKQEVFAAEAMIDGLIGRLVGAIADASAGRRRSGKRQLISN